ncbi:hypothetical protein Nisw_04670 [Candidatus Nitrosopumilus sp. SW]|uniref:hypothetical protein n=1 Tax=Candidatus Nitrosopumilus sp. SW TaxID=2508726 RepID=UPI0011524603|nr:hypothetical protein [Candidatus Nitrosopumilus sp. SW]QDI88861.1 hypothetical protein Nisw_04670 [Candidatus Nitrosopumilus sp. SW]
MTYQKATILISIPCFAVVAFSFIPLIFPALLIENTVLLQVRDVNYFEIGAWTIPLLLTNLIFFSLYFANKAKKLPSIINKITTYLTKNDISSKTAFLVLIILLTFYIIFSIDEFNHEEFELGDYAGVKKSVEELEFSNTLITHHLRYGLLYVSLLLFDNIRILPFFASIGLLLITYLLTLELTKKRLSGIVAFVTLLQSNMFLLFDTTATYENFWTLFYFLSLYLILKNSFPSSISYFCSILSKALTITYFPINLFAIFRTKQFSLKLLIGYGILVVILIFALFSNNFVHQEKINFDLTKIIVGFVSFSNFIRFDSLILLITIPTITILATKKWMNYKNIELVLFGIFFLFISNPITYGVIDMTSMPYRIVPLLVMISISFGMLFSNPKILGQK